MTWGLRLPLCEMAKESSFLGSKHMPGGKTSTNVYNSIADVAAETADRAKLEGFQIHPLGPLPPAAHRLFCTPTERANLQPQGRPQASSQAVNFLWHSEAPPGGCMRPQQEMRNIFLNQKGKRCLCVR